MTNTIIILSILVAFGAIYYFKRKSKAINEVSVLNDEIGNLNEPIISYSIYTVDLVLQQRYLNTPNKDFPNYFGILKNQQIEIDWNIINADFIFIEGVGLVNAVGRKTFYPTEKTKYIITAKNKEFEIKEEIFIHIFPVSIADKLLVKIPNISIKNEINIAKPTLSFQKLNITPMPIITVDKPNLISLNDAIKPNKNSNFTFQKLQDFINQKVSKKNNSQTQ